MKVLEVADLVVGYSPEIDVLRGVSLYVQDQEIVSLIGANGAGKSTLLKTLSGLLHPKAGRILYAGERIDHLEPHAIVGRGIVQISEEREIFDSLTVEENLTVACQTKRSKTKREQNLDFIFGTFPVLEERKNQVARTLSGGERKMLAVGKAIMQEPRLLLLDDISMGMAPKVVGILYARLREMIERLGIPVLLVEQNVEIALDFSERGYVVCTGEITMSGPSALLMETEEVKKSYMGI